VTRYVLVTRHPAECRELEALVAGHDIVIRPYPVLRLEDVDDDAGWRAVIEAIAGMEGTWLVLASPRAPERFVAQARQRRAGHLIALPAAAVGDGTAAAVTAAGLDLRLVGPGTGAGLAEQLVERLAPGAAVIFACGHDRRPELPAALRHAGHPVLPLEVYRMRQTPPRELPPLRGPRVDAVVLTSPRAARFYLDGVGGQPLPCSHVALGPTTRDAAAALGISCRTPEQPSIESLAEELCRI